MAEGASSFIRRGGLGEGASSFSEGRRVKGRALSVKKVGWVKEEEWGEGASSLGEGVRVVEGASSLREGRLKGRKISKLLS